jgi:hypothetical protein
MSLTTLTFNTLAGNDRLIVDWVNGNPIPPAGSAMTAVRRAERRAIRWW